MILTVSYRTRTGHHNIPTSKKNDPHFFWKVKRLPECQNNNSYRTSYIARYVCYEALKFFFCLAACSISILLASNIIPFFSSLAAKIAVTTILGAIGCLGAGVIANELYAGYKNNEPQPENAYN